MHHEFGHSDRKPFISVYDRGRHTHDIYVRSWNPEQRLWREKRSTEEFGVKPLYRINIKLKPQPPCRRGRRVQP